MAVDIHGDKSLYFRTGVDNSGLRTGANQAKGILGNLKKWIIRLGIFAGLMMGLKKLKTVTFDYAQTIEKAMNEVSTLSEEITQNFEHYRDKVVELSTQVVDSADKLTEGLYQIVSAGYDGADAMHVLEVAAKAATAGAADTGTAASVLTSAMTAWNVKMEDAEKVADSLFNTIKGGVVRLEEIEGQLGKVASIAAPVGIEMDNILAALQTMTKRGMPVAEAFQRMQGAIRDFAREFGTEWVENMSLQEKAIQVYEESEGKFKKILETMTDEGAQFVNIMGKYADSTRKDLESYIDTTGDMKGAWKKMTSSSINQSKIMADRIKATLLPIGHAVNNMWNEALGTINSLFDSTEDRLNQLDNEKNTYEENINILDELLETHEELSEKTNKTDEEKKKLQQTMNDIAKFVPEAIEQWDAERGAIKLNTEVLLDNIEGRKEGLKWRKAEVEQIEEFMKLQNQQIKMKGKEPVFEPVELQLTDPESIALIEYNIDLIKQRRKEITEELNQLSDREELTEKQTERMAALRDRLEGLNKQMEQHNELLKKINDEKKEEVETKKADIKFTEKISTKYKEQNAILNLISNSIDKLNNKEKTYNQEQNKRIKEQIKWWKDLYTQISEAQRLGYTEWRRRQARRLASGAELGQSNFGTAEDYGLTPQDSSGVKESYDQLQQQISNINSLFSDLSSTVGELDSGFGELINNIGQSIGGIGQVYGGMQSLGQGGLGGLQALAGVIQIGTTLSNIMYESFSNSEQEQRRLEEIKNELVQANRTLDAQLQSLEDQVGVDKIDALINIIDQTQKKTDSLRGDLVSGLKEFMDASEGRKVEGDSFVAQLREAFKDNQLSDKELRNLVPQLPEDSLTETYQGWEEMQDKVDGFTSQLRELLTGATASGIADGFTQSLKAGESFAKAFEDNFESAMRGAIIKAFKRQYLMKPINEWMEEFTSAAEGGLTDKEMQTLRENLSASLEGAEEEWNAIQDMLGDMGMTEDEKQSMQGAIQGVTEDTAGLLEGRMHSIQMHVAQHVSIAHDSLSTLKMIERNTFYNKRLYDFLTAEGRDIREIGGR